MNEQAPDRVPHPPSQRTYWDRVAGEKTFTHPLDLKSLGTHLELDARVLDVGCGYGRLCAQLASAGYGNVVGVDTSGGMVARGKALFPELDLRAMGNSLLPFGDGQIDAVLLFSVWTCIPADEDLQALMHEVQRVLRPGGLVYVSDLYLQTDGRNEQRYADGLERFGTEGVFELPEGVVLRHFTRAKVAELTAPFQRHSLAAMSFTTMNGNSARGFQFLGARTDSSTSCED